MLARIDLVLRFAYVTLIPILLVPFAGIFPLTGVLVTSTLATVVAVAGGERWRARVGGLRVIGRPLANLASLGDFYREHPPKPLVYYVFYPVLIPYWLIAPVARREFLLYRKLNAIAVVILVALAAHDYLVNYRPEIPFSFFIAEWIAMFLLQLVVTFVMVTPIVTTIVTLQHRGKRRTLVALGVCLALFAGLGVAIAHRMRGHDARLTARIHARVKAASRAFHDCRVEHPDSKHCGESDGALMAVAHGLDAAWKRLGTSPTTADIDAALDVAHADLEAYFKPDEANAFEMFFDGNVLILYVDFGRRERTLWAGRDRHHLLVRIDQLPADAHLVVHD